ncbi:MAG TPA: 6-pyruvoyl tetrahydropterin synthase family protein [Euryarchaeota archaeon]|nr:MAG: 6-carboxytetrahydropterin synthase QueD [Thermoplasmatales archaeon ex4484_6]RLF66427.1 MAG: 6-pyruvoyl tetrahydropterin synthase family protein [Thermoplasmata archaeon]HHD15403.1 6-pyruvoyl tetrahydropterin synthase family protein [Euryarchaeota archaeon]
MEHMIEIDGWSTGLRFSACHILLRHDKCSRLHGHSYCIHLRIRGDLGKDEMLLDFSRIKRFLREMAGELDHMTLIPTENSEIIIKNDEEKRNVMVDMNGKVYVFPRMDVIFLPISTTTVEEMSAYLLHRLLEEFEFPPNVKVVEIGLEEGPGQGGWTSRTIAE